MTDLFKGNIFKGDKVVWMVYFFLCMVSLVEVYSASSRLTFEGGHHWSPMLSQAGFLGIGFLLILLIHRIPCKWFMLGIILIVPALGLLIYTSLLGGSGEINGTNRWISIAGVSFQPSEVAKAVLLLWTAVFLAKSQTEKIVYVRGKKKKISGALKGNRYNTAFVWIGSATLIICGLIFADNVSTALMLFLVVVLMMFIGHVPRHLMFKGLGALMALGILAGTVAMTVPEDTLEKIPFCKRLVTVKHRIERMMGHDESGKENTAVYAEVAKDSTTGKPLDDDAARAAEEQRELKVLLSDKKSQSTYAKIAIANANFIGLGPGNSIQRDFLQHAESDFIFAIIIEELGILGALFVVFLYLILLIRVSRIAQKCRSFFPAYLVLGFGIMMVLQAFVNMCVAVGLVPVTGQTLPLISKGGTSILITSCYIGVILSVSRYANKVVTNTPFDVQPVPDGETSEYYSEGAMS